MKRSMIFGLLLTFILASFLYAQIPQTISYQGVLTDASGNPVPDGSYNLGFKLYDAAIGGTALWSESQSKTITKGVVDVILGSVNPLNLPFDKTYWLGISINQGPELSPRIQLTASPYSLNARTVADGSVTDAKIALGQVVKSLNNLKDNVTLAAGQNVTITPSGNTLTISATSGNAGDITSVYAGLGLVGGADLGPARLDVGLGDGISGDEYKIWLNTSYTDQLYVKKGQANSINTTMITDGTIQGVDINASTTVTVGKLQAGGTTNEPVGIYGISSGYGVKGVNSNSGKFGYLGSSGYAAFGNGMSGAWGALGASDYGVYGFASGSGKYAGYFAGNVRVVGTLTKTSGSFKIDHPLDPQNKYLYHSFVESPDMMNIYNGNIVLDAKGEAVVELPDWFGALNRDFRYQLTAIGAPGPNLYIAEEISNNRFKIAGGSAGMKVSWQVTGIRQDAYANAHRIPVEEMKKGEERGKYLHPEVFNQPESMGIDYAERQKAEQEMKQK